MSSTTCHDFKSPRTDASKRLPSIFMLVPIMFYVILLGGGYLSATSYMNYREKAKDRDYWHQYQTEQESSKASFESQHADVLKEKWKAEKLAQWVEGTRALQPISVAIIRSVPPEISLGELSLERSAEIPQQIVLGVRINNGTLQEVGRIQNAVGSLNYRAFNSQQAKAGDSLDYRTMLMWQQL